MIEVFLILKKIIVEFRFVRTGLPVVALKDVDDRYPPQKKSFRMLYYMYEHYINHFEWFVRADDDVYINTRKLERFLRSIDSTKPQFIGMIFHLICIYCYHTISYD